MVKRDKGPTQYGAWFKLEDTYGNSLDPGSYLQTGGFTSGDDEIWWYPLDAAEVNSLTAIALKVFIARSSSALPMTNLKYLDIYEDDSKNVLYDDDEPLDFTGSLGGKKTRPLYILYDIQKAENPSEDEDESGDESNSGDDTNSEEDDSDGPNRNYTLRLQATRSCGRVRDYMAMNIGDYSYTDGALHTMPNAMSGLEYYLAEKRNRRGKVTDRGWVDRRFATLLYN